MKIKKYTNYVSPVIGFIIMLFVAITAIDSPDWLLPRLYLFFAFGAVLFIGGYVGASIRSLKE
ncbi:MAG: hypothetical protein KAJ22_05790 [Candidatus Izimaplasma sp.]|nr:hypothetical protein [Candidatus Izimaplasma bacterium]